MSMSELYQMTKGKLDSSEEKNPSCSTDISFGHENDFVELVWENGKLAMQGQSSKARKSPIRNSLSSYFPKLRDKNIGSGSNSKSGKFGTMDSVLNEFYMSVPSGGMDLNQDDDMVPWLDYPSQESLQHEYCSDYLSEISGVTATEFSTQNTFASVGNRSSSNPSIRDSNIISVHNGMSLEQGNMSKISSAGVGEAAEPRSSTSQVHSLSFDRTSRVSDRIGNATSNSTHFVSGNPIQLPTPPSCDPVIRTHSLPSSSSSGFMNFSHFSQPAALVKTSLRNIASMTSSGLSNTERMGSGVKGSASSSRNPTNLNCQPVMMLSKVASNPSEAKPIDEQVAAKHSEDLGKNNTFENDRNLNEILSESANKVLLDGEKSIEPLVVSSVCSGNSVERVSDDPTHNLKRKHRDTEESECHSEDADEDSVGVKRAARARGGAGSKRSRAAEVHNLSERRRRDRINEKMRALQELIPNCNKVDKASMLDEAIEYLKTLQLQVQIMSMGAGMYMPPMMFPTGMPRMHAAHMAHFSPMAGMGMGMEANFGMSIPDKNAGSSGFPLIQVPPMQGAHFPGPPISRPTIHGMPGSNLQLFGLPCHGLPMSMPSSPFIPPSGRPMKSMENLDSALASISKDPVQNTNLQAMQNTGDNRSINQTTQCPATMKEFEQPALVQNEAQASDVIASGVVTLANEEDI